MEFLDLIESIRAEAATRERLFASADGQGVRGIRRGPGYDAKLAEAATLLANVMQGKAPAYRLQEAMTTSDFPYLMGDILDRQMLASYQETPSTYQNYCRVATVRDFRQVKRNTLDGGGGVLAEVKEQAPYPAASLTDGQYTYAVKKYGRRIPLSWETIINDDLDALREIPQILGSAARYSEEHFVTSLFAGATGPNATFYSAPNGNIITGNPALSVAGLQTAMTVLSEQKTIDGRPIMITGFELVVPPALRITAKNILNALQIELREAGGTSNQRLIAENWMKGEFNLNVNSTLPLISTTNGNTSWYLFASVAPTQRPAIEFARLRGHEAPEIFMKAPNAVRVGGGTTDPLNGDFDTDSVEYKVRHCFGGGLMDPKMSVASNGTGS